MSELVSDFGLVLVIASFAVMFFAGFVKGVVGFALPMITISGIGSLMSAELAIAAVVLPGLVTNLQQSVRQGVGPAWATFIKFWRMNLLMLLLIGVFAQLVVMLPDRVLFFILGTMVSLLGLVQLWGWRPHFAPRYNTLAETITGIVAGFFGGLAGVWGPPILLYLLARDIEKLEVVRATGIAFLLGSIMLLGAHLVSGVLNTTSLPFSAALIVPAVGGMLLGQIAQDRLDQQRFKRVTLVVLVVAGANLLRRALMG
ncbi:sulfite exporter TauE/SafE family protein [Oceanibium sediminis]|uniref:sulfite exporter TauE/SafE family protein n=1 Tax=Oceanibium sediminis TaxID=2026339 RepID=UPI000DD41743|nr:sulfite exporter TauE/SafE family protein [Oceanibium sediminis]